MLINASVYLPFPRPLVYETYRDRLLEVVGAMPTVKRVRLIARQMQGETLQQTYEWHGKSEIPGMMQAFLSEDLLTWTDFATWKSQTFITDWRIEPHAFREAITWHGQDRYLEEQQGTRIESRGELQINPHQLKGVPSFLSGQVSRFAEEMLVKQAEPNFVELSRCVQSYLEARSQPR
ncbi:MAG: hypothetical protein MUF72_18380 [Elainella sp. Prado103]|nr:hypothetical protein [Elainella sp. Prado103]